MNTKSDVKITRTIKYAICVLKCCILTTIKNSIIFKVILKIKCKTKRWKLQELQKCITYVKNALYLTTLKNAFNKSLVKNQRAIKMYSKRITKLTLNNNLKISLIQLCIYIKTL